MTNNLARCLEVVNLVGALVRTKRALCKRTVTLLSISGGQDSACLTAIIAQLRNQSEGRIGTVSCNHLWQEGSFYSLFHVARMSFLFKQSFCFVLATHKFPPSNEGEARIWRQNISQRIASFYQYPALCTGHTGSDRVETMLFNLIRGSGKRGLSSLYWSRFLTTCYPELCYLSNFEGTALPQKERLFLQGVNTLSRKKQVEFRQACALCNPQEIGIQSLYRCTVPATPRSASL